MNDSLYGRGLAHPLRLGVNGLAESADVAKVEESIRVILGTQRGERIMRPQFGSNLKTLAFAPGSPSTANLARYYVTEALTQWEPRIEVLDVQVTSDTRKGSVVLVIDIRYQLRATPGVRNLVYPFYLEQAQ